MSNVALIIMLIMGLVLTGLGWANEVMIRKETLLYLAELLTEKAKKDDKELDRLIKKGDELRDKKNIITTDEYADLLICTIENMGKINGKLETYSDIKRVIDNEISYKTFKSHKSKK